MPKIIGVDFDDVIMLTNEALAVWHNRNYKTSYQKKDILQWELTSLWQCSLEEMHRRIDEFFDSVEHASTTPISGVEQSLLLLSEKSLYVITARPKHARAQTTTLVERHVPSLLGRLHFTSETAGSDAFGRTKAEVCLELGVEVFIEDNLTYALSVASVGIPVLLFDNPWNQTDDLPTNVERVYSWKEIVQKLK